MGQFAGREALHAPVARAWEKNIPKIQRATPRDWKRHAIQKPPMIFKIERQRIAVQSEVDAFARLLNNCAQMRQQLFDAERLSQIIVSTTVNAQHLVRPASSCAQHEHWHSLA